MSDRIVRLLAGWGVLLALVGLPACAIDPVPTPGQDARGAATDDRDAAFGLDAANHAADQSAGGCTCPDDGSDCGEAGPTPCAEPDAVEVPEGAEP